MLPYLAVIKDSFRQAFSSWVLWLLLGAITLFLLLVAPLGYELAITSTIAGFDVTDASALAKRIENVGQQEAASPERRIWSLWGPGQQKKIVDAFRKAQQNRSERGGPPPRVIAQAELVSAFNGLLNQPDFYSEEAWSESRLGEETRDLLERRDDPQEPLSTDELRRLNRLLLEDAFPRHFPPRSAESVRVMYLGMDVSGELPFNKKQVDRFIQQWLMRPLLDFLIGVAGMLAALLATAPIIPQMFDPNSIALLLSKPISRSFLFLARFLGGCAYTFVCATYLLVGLWLLFGLRLGVWSDGFLRCIPIYVYLFAIYYTVSALVGVIWKNTIISALAPMALWVFCFVADMTYDIGDGFLNYSRLIEVRSNDSQLLATNEFGQLHRWSDGNKQWAPAAAAASLGEGKAILLGPYYDADNQRWVAACGAPNIGLGARRGGRLRLHFFPEDDLGSPQQQANLPLGSTALLPLSGGDWLAVSDSGLFRWSQEKPEPEADGQANKEGNLVEWAAGFQKRFLEQNNGPEFVASGPKDLTLYDPIAAAVSPDRSQTAVYSRGQLYIFQENQQRRYELQKSIQLEGEPSQAAALAWGKDSLLMVRLNDGLTWFDAQDWTIRKTFDPEPHSQPRFLQVSPDGDWFSILFHNRRLWLLNEQGELNQAAVRGQGDISAATLLKDQRLLVIDRTARVTEYDLQSGEQTQQYTPPMNGWETAYRYVLTPIYTVLPKPRKLSQTVQYLLTGEETTDLGLEPQNLRALRARIDPWKPVWESAIFMVVVLGAACLYIERQEF